MKKKIIIICVGTLGSIGFFLLVYFGSLDFLAINFQIFPILLILSLMFFPAGKEFFDSWWKLVYIFVPVSILLVASAPETGSAFLRLEGAVLAAGMDILFIILSFGALYRHFRRMSRG